MRKWMIGVLALVCITMMAVTAQAVSSVQVAGYNIDGELGLGNNSDTNLFTSVPLLDGVKDIGSAYFSTIALMNDGTVKATGYGALGGLGNGQDNNTNLFTTIPGLTGVRQIVSSADAHLALLSDGTVKSWGQGANGILGNGQWNDTNVPTTVTGLSNVKQLIGGALTHVFFAIKNDGTVWGWGYGNYGQLGSATPTAGTSWSNVFTPVSIPELVGAKQLAVNYECAYALMNDGTVKVAGYGNDGALGLGSYHGNTNVFTTIPGLSNVVEIFPLAYSAFAKLHGGTFKGWGYNNNGELALGSAGARQYSPTNIPNLTGFQKIFGGESHAYGIKNDGTVWGWGYNYYGELGLGNETQYETPQLLPLTNVSKFVGGSYRGFALFGLVSSWDLGYEDIGSGWRWLSWFGYYAPLDNNWIWHNEHGYMYCFPSSTPQSIYFYTMDMGWLWTSGTVYPYLYRFSGGSWLWYQVGSSGPRWFYNLTGGQWESH